jgi:hypothetical protein
VALLEEALAAVGEADLALRSQLLARLAVELYYAPSRDRSEALSAEAVATARAAGDDRAVAGALNARHVALWRPDRLAERLRTADEMIAAAARAGDGQLELQGRNWRATDLFEGGDMDGWRAEVEGYRGLAGRLRLPEFAWYGVLWGAVDALHAGRREEAAELAAQARAAGERAGDRNVAVFVGMLEFLDALQRAEYGDVDLAFVRDKVANSPAGMSYRCSYAWMLAERGEAGAAREQLAIVAADRFAALHLDANRPSALGELAGACRALEDRRTGAAVYDLLAPYAGRPLTAGRAIVSFGVADRHLGDLAALLGRRDAAVAHSEAAVELNRRMGMAAWAVHSRLGLAAALAGRGEDERGRELRAQALDEAAALGLTGLLRSPSRPAPATPELPQ